MIRKKLVWILIGLAFFDLIIPFPFFALAAMYIVVKRPARFLDFVRRLYATRN